MIIYAHSPLSKNKVYINANNGSVLYIESMIHNTDYTGTASTLYSGNKNIKTSLDNNSYILKEYDRGNGIFTMDMNNGTSYGSATNFYDSDNQWNNTQNNNNAALDAHWGAEMSYIDVTFDALSILGGPRFLGNQ